LDVDKVRRIYNGARAPGQEGSGSSTHSPFYILCVGSLQPHKNLPRLIRAYLQLRSSFPALELWVIGRAQPRFAEQPELSALLESPGVRRLGYLSETELGEAYRQAAVFCYPSLEEGFGLPVLEAMLCGTPVVTSSVSCLPEIAGPEAVLVDPTNENHLAEALHRVLEWSPEELNRRKQISSGWAREFNWEKSAQDYYQLYHELAGIPLPPNPKIG
jgi:glycosyltransferase involved in cell wall biosynthesis